jgi:hypothetical protein
VRVVAEQAQGTRKVFVGVDLTAAGASSGDRAHGLQGSRSSVLVAQIPAALLQRFGAQPGFVQAVDVEQQGQFQRVKVARSTTSCWPGPAGAATWPCPAPARVAATTSSPATHLLQPQAIGLPAAGHCGQSSACLLDAAGGVRWPFQRM